MKGFVKEEGIKTTLTGYEKIAILLGEVGKSATENIMKHLILSQKQLQKINVAFMTLARYDSRNSYMTQRELTVLDEFMLYAKNHNFYKEVLHINVQKTQDKNSKIASMAHDEPEAVASLLQNWLTKE